MAPRDRSNPNSYKVRPAKVAGSPEGLFKYPTGRSGLEALNYDPEIIQALHASEKFGR